MTETYTKSIRIYWTLIVLGLAVRVVAMTASGTSDLEVFNRWSRYVFLNGVSGIYGLPNYADYAPGSIYFLAIAAHIVDPFNPKLVNPLFQHIVVNLFPVILSGLTTVALYRFTARQFDQKWARIVSLAFWLNPAVILHTPLLGYQDMNFLFFDVLALIFLFDRRYSWAVALTFIAGLVKQPGFLIAPVVAYTLLRETKWQNWIGYGTIAVAITILFYLPFMGSRVHLNEAYGGLQRLLAQQFLSGNGPNLWWLATGYIEHHTCLSCPSPFLTEPITKLRYITLADFSAFFHIPAKIIAYALLGTFTITNIWVLHRTLSTNRWMIFFTSAFEVFSYQALAIAVHENHLIYFFPMFVFLLPLGRNYRVIYTSASVLFFSSLFAFYGFGRDWELPFVWIRTFPGFDITLGLAVFNLGLLARLTTLAIKLARTSPQAQSKL